MIPSLPRDLKKVVYNSVFKRLMTWWHLCNKKNKSAGDLKCLYSNDYTLFEDGKRPPKPGNQNDDDGTSKNNCYDGKQ